MIELVTDLPEGVIGVRLSGQVDANEYKDVINPAIEAARAKSGKVNALVILEPSVNYTLGASWQDMKLGMSHPFSWNRVAVLADDTIGPDWCRFSASSCPVNSSDFVWARRRQRKTGWQVHPASLSTWW